MPSEAYLRIAQNIADELNNGKFAFKTYNREQILEHINANTTQKAVRITKNRLNELDEALSSYGFCLYPRDTRGIQWRVYRLSTVAGTILRLILNPNIDSDRHFATILSKLHNEHEKYEP